MAQGIADAFRDAALLAEAIDAGLSGRRPLEETLDEYERRRNDVATPVFDYTCQRAALEPPPPPTRRLLAALRGNPEETDRFLNTVAGTVPITEFFSPENVRRVMDAV
jgi:2-polyprenyl-6-methoxyphenol hydroxylase-like FAD-dependent oxidoreductase